MKNVVLGVSGSVAAYRACDLARDLVRAGCTVRVCLTDGAQRFVSPALFEALTGQPCLMDTFEEPERGRMAHIEWARAAEALLIAPATANVMNKIANGYADDMLTTIALAYEGPLVIAPAMNPSMFANDATQKSLSVLRARAAVVVEPSEGTVACGEQGQGKLATNEQIVLAVLSVINASTLLQGIRVVVSSGPTEEPLDDVRFLTNRSSGKMGAAVARAAILMGAKVTVVAGPQRAALPLSATVVNVRTALEMRAAVLDAVKDADYFVSVAAVADYRPAEPVKGKIRSGSLSQIAVVPNPDIVAEVAALNSCRTIAFAAETSLDLASAQEKLTKKRVYAIALNNVGKHGIGFDSEENELTLLFSDGRSPESGLLSKLNCALWLWSRLSDERA